MEEEIWLYNMKCQPTITVNIVLSQGNDLHLHGGPQHRTSLTPSSRRVFNASSLLQEIMIILSWHFKAGGRVLTVVVSTGSTDDWCLTAGPESWLSNHLKMCPPILVLNNNLFWFQLKSVDIIQFIFPPLYPFPPHSPGRHSVRVDPQVCLQSTDQKFPNLAPARNV